MTGEAWEAWEALAVEGPEVEGSSDSQRPGCLSRDGCLSPGIADDLLCAADLRAQRPQNRGVLCGGTGTLCGGHRGVVLLDERVESGRASSHHGGRMFTVSADQGVGLGGGRQA